jgi:hypothetical protein
MTVCQVETHAAARGRLCRRFRGPTGGTAFATMHSVHGGTATNDIARDTRKAPRTANRTVQRATFALGMALGTSSFIQPPARDTVHHTAGAK